MKVISGNQHEKLVEVGLVYREHEWDKLGKENNRLKELNKRTL